MGFGLFEIVLFITLALGGLCISFFVYWPYSLVLIVLANGWLRGKPLALFACAWFGLTVWTVAFFKTLFEMGEMLGGIWRDTGAYMLAGLAVLGALGWSMLFFRWIAKWTKQLAASKSNAMENSNTPPTPATPSVPRFQIWFQDLLLAMFCYGAALLVVDRLNTEVQFKLAVFVVAAGYVLGAGSIGLLIAVDVCRRTVHGQQAFNRAVIFVSIVWLVPLSLPVALVAWWTWRRQVFDVSSLVLAARSY